MHESKCSPRNVYGFYIPQELPILIGKYDAGYEYRDPIDPSMSLWHIEHSGFMCSGMYCRKLFPHIPLRWTKVFGLSVEVDGTEQFLPALVLGFRHSGKDIIDVTKPEHIEEIKRVLHLGDQEPQWFMVRDYFIPSPIYPRIVRAPFPLPYEDEKPKNLASSVTE